MANFFTGERVQKGYGLCGSWKQLKLYRIFSGSPAVFL